MHDTARARYPFALMTEALTRLLHVKQGDQEQLLDYVKRFKEARDVITSIVGKDILNKFIENTQEYQDIKDSNKAAEQKMMKDEAFDKWMAYLLLKNSDQTKYGGLINGLTLQYVMGHKQYPADVTAVTDVLSNYKWDPSYKEKLEKLKKQKTKSKRDDDDTISTLSMNTKTSFAQGELTCYCCGKKGHIAQKCLKKNTIPKNEWVINKARVYLQQTREEEEDSSINADDASIVESTRSARSTRSGHERRKEEWSGLHVSQVKKCKCFYAQEEDVIILDTGLSIGIVKDKKLVDKIKPSKSMLELATNAGRKKITQEAEVPGYGTVWFDKDALANIFSFAELKDKYQITYDSSQEDAFLIHMENKVVKFKRTPDGLYCYKVPETYKESLASKPQESKCNLVDTVAKNRQGYMQHQFECAKLAQKLYHIVRMPTIQSFKAMLRTNIIKNCPVTIEDVTMAKKIFGPSMSSLKGKSTRRKPKPVKKDLIKIPKELIMKHHNIKLCMDTMFVNGCGMLTMIDRTVKYQSLVPMKGKKHVDYYHAIDKILRLYNSTGFIVRVIQCDREYQEMMDEVKDELDVDMNYTSASEHVPEAERNNCMIKERIRAAFW